MVESAIQATRAEQSHPGVNSVIYGPVKLKPFKSKSLSSICSSIRDITIPVNEANAIVSLLVMKPLILGYKCFKNGSIGKKSEMLCKACGLPEK